MSFLDNIEDHLKTLEQKKSKLQREKFSLVHDCDCSFCDYDGVADEDRFDEIVLELADLNKAIERVKAYRLRAERQPA